MSEQSLNIKLSDQDSIKVIVGFADKPDIKDVVMIIKAGNVRIFQPLRPAEACELAFALLAAAKTLDEAEPAAAPH